MIYTVIYITPNQGMCKKEFKSVSKAREWVGDFFLKTQTYWDREDFNIYAIVKGKCQYWSENQSDGRDRETDGVQ